MTRTLALLLLVCGMAAAKLKPISTYFDVCHRNQNSEQMSQCIRKSIEKARPLLIKGIPELKLLPLDPLSIDKMEMKENSGRFQFSQTLSNLKIYGLGAFVIKDLKLNLEKMSMNVTTFTPHLRMEGSYTMDGQVMVLPIQGSGLASYNFTDVTTTDYVTLKKVKRNNKTYLSVRTYEQRIEPKGAHSHFTNLFNGDKRLGDATNAFLNENWYEAFNTYRSLPERAFSEFSRNQAEQVYSRYTFDELFPE